MKCHMYENELPEEGDLVMVKILSIDDGGAQCILLEYGGIEGLLPSTEYSRKRIRSIKKLVRVGKKDVLTVIRVDPEKQYIDLSKKHVSKTDFEEVTSKFQKSNFVHSCMKQLCYKHQQSLSLKDIYTQIGWPMYEEFGHAFNGLEQAAKDLSILDKYQLDNSVRETLRKSLEHRFKQKPQTVHCIVEVSCIGIDGINAVRESLIEAKRECNTPETPLDISIHKCPQYCISSKGTDIESMKQNIEKATAIIKSKIVSYNGGIFSVKSDVHVQ